MVKKGPGRPVALLAAKAAFGSRSVGKERHGAAEGLYKGLGAGASG